MEKFVDKLETEIQLGNVTEFMVLVNNATETQWFHNLSSLALSIAFPKGRIRFWSPTRESKTPLQGQAIFYGGKHSVEFERAFRDTCILCDISTVLTYEERELNPTQGPRKADN